MEINSPLDGISAWRSANTIECSPGNGFHLVLAQCLCCCDPAVAGRVIWHRSAVCRVMQNCWRLRGLSDFSRHSDVMYVDETGERRRRVLKFQRPCAFFTSPRHSDAILSPILLLSRIVTVFTAHLYLRSYTTSLLLFIKLIYCCLLLIATFSQNWEK